MSARVFVDRVEAHLSCGVYDLAVVVYTVVFDCLGP